MARAQGARSQLAAAFETTYGTAPASGYFQMPFASASLGAEQPLLTSELLGYGRDPLAPIKDAVTADGDLVVPVDAEAFGFWLKAAFGNPNTTGTTDKTHIFKSGGWTLPSMAIEVAMPEVPRFAMYTGCVLDQLSWQMQRSGLLTATAKLIAQGETVATSTAAGTPTTWTLQRFGHFNGSIKRNGTALGNIVTADIQYSNNLDRIETIRADGRIDGADPSNAALTGRIDVRFADTTLMDQALNGTSASLEFFYMITPTLSLAVTAHEVYLPRPRVEVQGPQGIQAASIGRPPTMPPPARCAPSSSRTRLRVTDMLKLNLSNEPTWLDLGHGVRIRLLPLTTALMVAARNDPAIADLPEDSGDEESALVFAKALGRIAIVGWEGVGDENGDPVAVTPDGIDALLDVWPLFEAFQTEYVAGGLMLDQEKNVSSPLPSGPSAGAMDTARPVRKPAKPARKS